MLSTSQEVLLVSNFYYLKWSEEKETKNTQMIQILPSIVEVGEDRPLQEKK